MLTILWDNDGVLVDTEGLYFRATQEVLRTVGVHLTADQFKEMADALERLTARQPHDVSPGLLAEIAKLVHPEPQRDKEDAVDHDTVLEDWRRNAPSHDDENYEFLRSLKFRDYGFDPDELAAELHASVFQAVDCTRCGNCCKTLDTKVTSSDAERVAEHLNVATKAFAEAYLATDEFGDQKFRQQPCPFLGEDGRCRIYSVRPADCREYPHTDKKRFTSRTMVHANNALACPAVFWIVEQMRSRSLNRRSKPRRSDGRGHR